MGYSILREEASNEMKLEMSVRASPLIELQALVAFRRRFGHRSVFGALAISGRSFILTGVFA